MMRIALVAGAVLLAVSFSHPAAAQSAKALVGAWAPAAAVVIDANGNKTDTFGPRPTGMLIFTADGQYTAVIRRADLPKFAGAARTKGTAEENQAVVAGSIAHYGRYSVDEKDKTVTFYVQASTFANWDGLAQRRPFTVRGDELIYRVPSPSTGSGSAELVWKRIKPQL